MSSAAFRMGTPIERYPRRRAAGKRWSAGRGALCGEEGEAGHPWCEAVGSGLSGQVKEERRQVPEVGQVCRGLGRLPEHRDGLACEGSVDARLGREDRR